MWSYVIETSHAPEDYENGSQEAYWCEVWDTETGEVVFRTGESKTAAPARKAAAAWVRARESEKAKERRKDNKFGRIVPCI